MDWNYKFGQAGVGNQTERPQKIRIKNIYGSTIPAFAAMKCNYDYTNNLFEVTRPDADNLSNVLINNETELVAGQTREIDHLTIFKALSETCVVGDSLGTQEDSFILKNGNTGFVAMSGDSGGVAAVRFFSVASNIKNLNFSIDIDNYDSGSISSYIKLIDVYVSEEEIIIPENSLLYFPNFTYYIYGEEGTYSNPISIGSNILFTDNEDTILTGFSPPSFGCGKYGEMPDTFNGYGGYNNIYRTGNLPSRPIAYNMANSTNISFSKIKLSLKSQVQAGCQSSTFTLIVSGAYSITLGDNWWLNLPSY